MGLFTLTFDTNGVFSAEAPKLAVYYGGAKISQSYVSIGSNSLSFELDTDNFSQSSLRFYFLNSGAETDRTVEISNVAVNNVPVLLTTFTTNQGADVTPTRIELEQGEYSDTDVSDELGIEAPIIEGTENGDKIFANALGNEIHGLGGNDKLYGGVGNDTLRGGDGNDAISGKFGDDEIHGDLGNDNLWGGYGNDTLYGGEGNDRIRADHGDDIVDGGAGSDRLYAGAGDDTVHGGDGDDFIYGNSGENHLFGDAGNDKISGGSDNDIIDGGADQDTLHGWDGDDTINGGDGNDIIAGDDGNDTLYGDAGNDMLAGDLGDDTLYGGEGSDRLVGHEGNDTLHGETGNDILEGRQGDDTVNGEDGDDTIYGGAGHDVLNGGEGDDIILGDDITPVIGEAGQLFGITQTSGAQWHSVSFSGEISNAVVKMTMNTRVGGHQSTMRVRNVSDTGFEFQIDEWDYLDGAHGGAENISWLAVSEGVHTLENGLTIEAGRTTATNEAFENVSFAGSYDTAPVVFSQLMSDNDTAAVALRNRNVSETGFETQMQEEEVADGIHATEDIGWIAIDVGGSVDSGLLVGTTGDVVTHATTSIDFGSDFAVTTPVLLADMQTTDGGDTAVVRGIGGVDSSGADIFLEEEASREAELNHTTEDVGYFALTTGLIHADGVDGNDVISGGAGTDILYGGDGSDTFLFEATTAFDGVDTIRDFNIGADDALDFSDILGGLGVDTTNIDDYLDFATDGTNTTVSIDVDGTANGANFQDVVTLNGLTGLDEATMLTNGNIII